MAQDPAYRILRRLLDAETARRQFVVCAAEDRVLRIATGEESTLLSVRAAIDWVDDLEMQARQEQCRDELDPVIERVRDVTYDVGTPNADATED